MWGLRPDNPAERASPGRYDAAEIRPPSADEVRRLFDAAVEKDHERLTFVAREAETGARRSELAALRFNDFAEGASASRSSRPPALREAARPATGQCRRAGSGRVEGPATPVRQ